jgi:hypothetical protein
MRNRALLSWLAAALIFGFIAAPGQFVSHASSSGIVISAVYGGGGNIGAPDWSHDYVELFNAGSAAVNINGWSLQYGAASQTTWKNLTILPNTWILPGQYFLVREAAGTGGGGDPLPRPDYIPEPLRHMASTSHKVALFTTSTPFAGGADPTGSPDFVDMVSYGTSNAYEGAGPAPALNNDTQAVRADSGCQDTNNNQADFNVIDEFVPRNSASPINLCGAREQLLNNSDFNLDSDGNKIPDNWTLKNPTNDKMLCDNARRNVSFAGRCAVKFVGGAGERAQLKQNVKLTGLTFNADDTLTLSSYFLANNPAAKGQLVMFVHYASMSTPVKSFIAISPNAAFTHISAPSHTITGSDVTMIRVMFKHRSPSGKVFLDGSSLVYEPSGSRDESSELLPVPAAPVLTVPNN